MNRNANFLREAKQSGRKIAALTAYDYPTARLLDICDLDFLLVGDSLGMVVLGYPDTTHVRIEHMLHHTEAVARGAKQTWIVADLPAQSYLTPSSALANSRRLIDAGADSVKIEGGRECLPMIEAIRGAEIPLVGHLGMLPQRVLEEGGYRIKGKSDTEATGLLEDAQALDEMGVSAIVLELVHAPLAQTLTSQIAAPTIGIGSGPGCDGQILVLHDVIGLSPWFRPRFAQARADVASSIQSAVQGFVAEVRTPSP